MTSADFSIIHSTFFSGLTSAVTTLRLLPGQYTFKAPGNSEIFFFFTVTNSGTVNYDSALDSFVSGRGSSTLAVSGYPITFDARTLTSADFSISRFFSGPTSTVATLRLLPETYTFIAPANQENFFFFTVTNSGTVQYASTLNTCVSGRDTNGLTVFCIPGVNAPPVAQCQNVTVPTGSSTCSADASINNGSFDPDGTIVTSSQSPAGPYPLGTTPVTMTVTDNQGASAVCTANVTVADTTPPVIICPPDKEAIAPLGATGVPLTYTAPTRTDNCAYFTIPCDPASGSTFVVGTTTVVTCGVRDAANSRATCSFNVTVQTPQTAIQEIQEIVNDMRGLEPGVLIDHLDEAVMLLGDLRAAAENLLRWDGTPPQPPAPVNTYGGPPEIHSPGWDYSPNTMVRVVCSTLITELLQHAYMFSIGTSPKAKDYHDVIKAENRFTLIDNVNDILPGDIIAIKYPDGSDDDSGDSERITGVTGHVMLVAEWPTFYSTTACPESPEPGTEQYTVKVIDSSSSYHGDFDTRRSNPGGLGLGVFRLYVRGSGEIVGYTWSTICKVKDPVTGDLEPVEVYGQDPNDPMTRHLVVGRLVPGSQIGSDATAMSQAKVSEGGLTKAEANWLINILKAAIQQLDRGNRTPAINQLNAFINQVEALERSGRLSSDQADALITSVQAVIDAL
ncbi:MAG: HYR domain-containing protein [Acidobacteria bacterium]|nr:HYR domain-containing protein [Acidobacteriota bacterium]